MSDAYRIAPQFGNTLPRLSDPLLVVMFSGWIDTSVAAGNAMESLISETGATMLLEFDTDMFVDYRARRIAQAPASAGPRNDCARRLSARQLHD